MNAVNPVFSNALRSVAPNKSNEVVLIKEYFQEVGDPLNTTILCIEVKYDPKECVVTEIRDVYVINRRQKSTVTFISDIMMKHFDIDKKVDEIDWRALYADKMHNDYISSEL